MWRQLSQKSGLEVEHRGQMILTMLLRKFLEIDLLRYQQNRREAFYLFTIWSKLAAFDFSLKGFEELGQDEECPSIGW